MLTGEEADDQHFGDADAHQRHPGCVGPIAISVAPVPYHGPSRIATASVGTRPGQIGRSAGNVQRLQEQSHEPGADCQRKAVRACAGHQMNKPWESVH